MVSAVVSGEAASSLQGAPEVAKVNEKGLLMSLYTTNTPGAMPAQTTLGGPRTGPGVCWQP